MGALFGLGTDIAEIGIKTGTPKQTTDPVPDKDTTTKTKDLTSTEGPF